MITVTTFFYCPNIPIFASKLTIMIALTEPLDTFIIWAYSDSQNLKKTPHNLTLSRKVNDFIDIIEMKLGKDRSFEAIAATESARLFDLRFEIIEWLATEQQTLSHYRQKIQNQIVEKLNIDVYSDLATQIARYLIAYQKILSPLLETTNLDSFEQIAASLPPEKPNYHTFSLIGLHPSPRVQYVKNWVDASLRFEIGLLIADLLFTEHITLSEARISELSQFIKDSILKFGAYSIFTEFWQPQESDDNRLFNAMSVLAATIEMDNRIVHKMNLETLTQLTA
jgi:hypothetical protein